jgi:hypothetical protein
VVAPSSPLSGHADQQSMREPHAEVLWAISGVGSHRSCRLQIGAAAQVSHPLCLPHGAPQEVHGHPVYCNVSSSSNQAWSSTASAGEDFAHPSQPWRVENIGAIDGPSRC